MPTPDPGPDRTVDRPDAASRSPAGVVGAPGQTEPRRLRCLVVDDEREITRVVEAILAPALAVEAAGDGATALHVIQRDPPDLLLLDLRLPDMDGLHLLDTVRRMRPDLAAIIMTGHSSEAVAIAAANLGVSGFLVKPFGVRELRRVVTNAWALRLGRRLVAADEPASRRRPMAPAAGADLLSDSEPMRPILARTTPRRLARRPRAFGLTRRRSTRRARIEHRLATAKALLGETTEPVKAIAAELGFHDAAHFCRQFRRWVGQTPLGYRRRARALRVI